MLVKCPDVYMAAWLLMNGADFVSMQTKQLKAGKGKKFGFHQRWVIDMLFEGSMEIIDEWKMGTAEGNIREYAEARKKLKRLIKNYENRYSR